MEIPGTMWEALKSGYRFTGAENQKLSPDGKQVTGDYKLEKEGAVDLRVPFVATCAPGDPHDWKRLLTVGSPRSAL